jgi:hypothetical protein
LKTLACCLALSLTACTGADFVAVDPPDAAPEASGDDVLEMTHDAGHDADADTDADAAADVAPDSPADVATDVATGDASDASCVLASSFFCGGGNVTPPNQFCWSQTDNGTQGVANMPSECMTCSEYTCACWLAHEGGAFCNVKSCADMDGHPGQILVTCQ